MKNHTNFNALQTKTVERQSVNVNTKAWIRDCHIKLVHPRFHNGHAWTNISFSCPYSKSGYASVSVNNQQVFNVTRDDGSLVENVRNILLGELDDIRKVSVCTGVTKNGKSIYDNIYLTNAQIVNFFYGGREAYYLNKYGHSVKNTPVNDKPTVEQENKSKNYVTPEWPRKSYWRTTPSGKRVFVRGSVCKRHALTQA